MQMHACAALMHPPTAAQVVAVTRAMLRVRS